MKGISKYYFGQITAAVSLLFLATLAVYGCWVNIRTLGPVGHDEINYYNHQRELIAEHDGKLTLSYLYDTFHKVLPAKEPAWRILSEPVIRMFGMDIRYLRLYAALYLIPTTLLLFFGMRGLSGTLSSWIMSTLFLYSFGVLGTSIRWMMEFPMYFCGALILLATIRFFRSPEPTAGQWIFLGTAIGLGAYTKTTLLILSCLICIIGWGYSFFENSGRARRIAIFKAGVLAYIIASFWWASHFPYALSYAMYASQWERGGAAADGWHVMVEGLRAAFPLAIGWWGTGLLIAIVISGGITWVKQKTAISVKPTTFSRGCYIILGIAVLFQYVLYFKAGTFGARHITVVLPFLFCLVAGILRYTLDANKRLRIPLLLLYSGLLFIQIGSVFSENLRIGKALAWATDAYDGDFSGLLRISPVEEWAGSEEPIHFACIGGNSWFSPHSIKAAYPAEISLKMVYHMPAGTDPLEAKPVPADPDSALAKIEVYDAIYVLQGYDPSKPTKQMRMGKSNDAFHNQAENGLNDFVAERLYQNNRFLFAGSVQIRPDQNVLLFLKNK